MSCRSRRVAHRTIRPTCEPSTSDATRDAPATTSPCRSGRTTRHGGASRPRTLGVIRGLAARGVAGGVIRRRSLRFDRGGSAARALPPSARGLVRLPFATIPVPAARVLSWSSTSANCRPHSRPALSGSLDERDSANQPTTRKDQGMRSTQHRARRDDSRRGHGAQEGNSKRKW